MRRESLLVLSFALVLNACSSPGSSTKQDAAAGTGGWGPTGGSATGGLLANTGGSGATTGGVSTRTGGEVTPTGGTALPSGGSVTAAGGTVTPVGGSITFGGTVAATGGNRTGGAATGGAKTGSATATNTATGILTGTALTTITHTATTTVTATTTATSTIADALYVSPTGADTNPGTKDQPLLSLSIAVTKAVAGSTIYMRGGTYWYTTTITLAASGTKDNPIRIFNYPNEIPVLNYALQPYASAQRAILLSGNYWHLKGLEICYAGDNGIKLEGSHNRIEQCVFHHNGDSGLQLGFAHTTANPTGELCAYNEIINCDSYLNFDFDNAGGDADGFAAKMHQGKGNVFRGCRSWHNGDDGWDLFETDWPVEILNCWTWHNGDRADHEPLYLAKMGKKMSSYQGNGNGFKLGGNGTGGSSKGTHVVKNCVAFDSNFQAKKGFDQNSHSGGVLVQNCTAFNNGYNYMFESDSGAGTANQFDNNIEFGHKAAMAFEFSAGAILNNNSWQLTTPATAADFASLAETLALAPRQADGSLPVNDFARLVETSKLIDKGKDVGLPFNGAAPDLGAFECK